MHARRLRRERTGRRRALVLALTAALLAAGAALAAMPAARERVLEILSLGDEVSVGHVERLPRLPRLADLELGRRVSLAAADRAVPFDVLVPRALGPPDAAYLSSFVLGGDVALTYRPRPGRAPAGSRGIGVLIGQFRGDHFGERLVSEIVTSASSLELLRIDGHEALWIPAQHAFSYLPPEPPAGYRPLRVASRALIVKRGDLYVRIESRLSRRAAIAVARSLEPRD